MRRIDFVRSVVLAFGLFGLVGCAHNASTDEYNEGATTAIHAKTPQFERCYALYGNGKPLEVWIEFSVNYNGELQFVNVAESEVHFSNAKFDECALKAFREIRFPEADPYARAASGKYPIRFRSSMSLEK